MNGFTGLDLGVLVVYLLGVTAWGAWLGRGQSGATDYFLGSRSLPWWAVLLSVVATETSTLTFLSIPGVSYLGTMTFLQLTLGYLLGRALLTGRFGEGTRRLTSGVFMGTRLLADSVRLFATAIPLALITGWDYPVSIGVIGALTVVYTYLGGIKAVVWVDAVQMVLYLVGAILAAWVLQGVVDGGWAAILSQAAEAGKLRVVDVSLDPGIPYTLWGGVLGGAFLSMASHGTDQLIVQRLLTCRDLASSRRALVGSGFAVILQFLVFLLIGLGLWAFYQGRAFERSDEIFALFIVQELPAGLTGLLIAGVFAAAMSSLSSSINALASASAYDFWAPLAGAEGDEQRILRAGKGFTLLWSALLVGGAIVFIPLSRETSAVEVALAVASLVYGGLLGAFALGSLGTRADAFSVKVGMLAGIGVVTLVWVFARESLAWPWFVPLGSVVTFAVGILLGRGRMGSQGAGEVAG